MGTGSTGWLWFSALATVWITPVFVSIPYFGRHFQVKPDVFTAWYFASVGVGVAVWLCVSGHAADLLPGRPAVVLGIVLVGLVFGTVANSCLFRAVSLAPNPGLPPVIYSGASVIVFWGSALLANYLPRLFAQVNTDIDRFLGILLIIAGVFLTAGGWPLLKGAAIR